MSVWVPSGYSGFLPHSKVMRVRSIYELASDDFSMLALWWTGNLSVVYNASAPMSTGTGGVVAITQCVTMLELLSSYRWCCSWSAVTSSSFSLWRPISAFCRLMISLYLLSSSSQRGRSSSRHFIYRTPCIFVNMEKQLLISSSHI